MLHRRPNNGHYRTRVYTRPKEPPLALCTRNITYYYNSRYSKTFTTLSEQLRLKQLFTYSCKLTQFENSVRQTQA